MAAVCDSEQYGEHIAADPKNRDVLMAMDPKRYIAVMEHCDKLFLAGANFTIMGVTDDQLRSIKAATVAIAGNDNTHNWADGQRRAKAHPRQQAASAADRGQGRAADLVRGMSGV